MPMIYCLFCGSETDTGYRCVKCRAHVPPGVRGETARVPTTNLIDKVERMKEQPHMTKDFRDELTSLINRHSVENIADVPDFMLADMVCTVIEALGPKIKQLLDWHGCDSVCHPRPIALVEPKRQTLAEVFAHDIVESSGKAKADRHTWDTVKLARLLERAVKYLEVGKREFAPNTTNSDVDVFLNEVENDETIQQYFSWLPQKCKNTNYFS